MYTVFEGAVEAIALDETQNLLAVVGLGRVVILRILLDNTRSNLLLEVVKWMPTDHSSSFTSRASD